MKIYIYIIPYMYVCVYMYVYVYRCIYIHIHLRKLLSEIRVNASPSSDSESDFEVCVYQSFIPDCLNE